MQINPSTINIKTCPYINKETGKFNKNYKTGKGFWKSGGIGRIVKQHTGIGLEKRKEKYKQYLTTNNNYDPFAEKKLINIVGSDKIDQKGYIAALWNCAHTTLIEQASKGLSAITEEKIKALFDVLYDNTQKHLSLTIDGNKFSIKDWHAIKTIAHDKNLSWPQVLALACAVETKMPFLSHEGKKDMFIFLLNKGFHKEQVVLWIKDSEKKIQHFYDIGHKTLLENQNKISFQEYLSYSLPPSQRYLKDCPYMNNQGEFIKKFKTGEHFLKKQGILTNLKLSMGTIDSKIRDKHLKYLSLPGISEQYMQKILLSPEEDFIYDVKFNNQDTKELWKLAHTMNACKVSQCLPRLKVITKENVTETFDELYQKTKRYSQLSFGSKKLSIEAFEDIDRIMKIQQLPWSHVWELAGYIQEFHPEISLEEKSELLTGLLNGTKKENGLNEKDDSLRELSRQLNNLDNDSETDPSIEFANRLNQLTNNTDEDSLERFWA